MNLTPLRVLLVEDSEDDARLVLRALTQAGYQPEHLRVQTAESLINALGLLPADSGSPSAASPQPPWDIVLSDYAMPGFSGADALEIVKQSGRGGEPSDLPFIIVSGAIGEETAVALMKAGAHDYITKDKLSRLGPAVARELHEALSRRERRRAQAALQVSEERYRALAETAHDFIFMLGPDARIEYVNSTAAAEFGRGGGPSEPAGITGKTLFDVFPGPVAERQWRNVKAVLETGMPLYVRSQCEFPRHELWLDTWLAPVFEQPSAASRKPQAVRSVVGISRNVTHLVEVELALRTSEERYRSLFERALDVIYVHDLGGRFLAMNPAGERLLGYTQDQLRSMTFAQVVHPDSLALAQRNMQEKVQGKATQTAYELLVRTRAGETRLLELVSRPVIEAGVPVAIQGHARDITERREAERQVRESEERYRSLVELSPDAVIVHIQGRIEYANPAALRLVRADSETQVVGKSLLDFVHPDFREQVTQRVRTMSSNGMQVPLAEEKFLRLDGSVIDVEAAAMPIKYAAAGHKPQATSDQSSPASSAILVVFRDVTERKQAEVALRQSEARYRLLFEATPIGIAVFHPDGGIIAVNQFMQDLSGYAFTDFKQLGIGAVFVDPDERNRFFQAIQPRATSHQPPATSHKLPTTNHQPEEVGVRNWETRLRRKDGSTCYVLMNVDRLEFAGSSILLATARDITDRKQVEIRLLRLNQLYSVLSQVNQAFVRERDTVRLCQEACRILVRSGGYRLAWVGIIDSDRRQLKPIARFGDDQGYVDRLRIPIDRPGGHGPAATALLQGRPNVRTDLEAAPRDMRHHVEAAEQGFRAAAAFPLRVNDEVIGAISIYAAEPDYFDAEQIRLLEALAADLSFAIQSAQLEEYRQATGPKREIPKSETRNPKHPD